MSDGHNPSADPEQHTQEARATGDSTQNIGPYRLLQRLGEGGMGDVWLAEQTRPIHRQVALKIIKAGMDTAHVVARFEAERQALAIMSHPAIAQVFDAGATPQGRPFFAMEYVRGEPITTYCNNHRLSSRQRLDLFLDVCEGVQHAHQKGVIHRDLKPSNILVTERDGQAAPKIIDFGLAKAMTLSLTDRTLHTEFGVLLGTPEYMSPEQAEISGLDVDTRSDVYSLGVILYELLTGVLPFDAKTLREQPLDEIRRTIRDVEPPRPSTRVTALASRRVTHTFVAAKELRRDLDWITMKALEKDRTRRYGSVSDLAADLRRHLDHLPIVAGPPHAGYRTRKFVRRHRIGVGLGAGLIVLLTAFSITTAVQARRIAHERDRANQEAETAKAVNDFLQNDLLAQASADTQARPDRKPDPDLTVRAALDRAAANIEGKFKNQPLLEASIRHTIGDAFRGLGLYAQGQFQLQRALELRRRQLGETHPDTLETGRTLAVLYRLQGQYAKAEPLLIKALELYKNRSNERPRDTLETMIQLAAVYQHEGKYQEAESLYKKALEISIQVLGDENDTTLDSMNDLAVLYQLERKYSEAEQLLSKALEIRRRVSGEQHPETLTVINNLALIALRQRKYAQAESLFATNLESVRKVLGEKHLITLQSMNNLALAYRGEGEYMKAEILFAKALEILRSDLGAEHPNTSRTMYNLGRLYLDEGKYSQAESLLSGALQLRKRLLGEDHPDTLFTMHALAVLYGYERKYSQADGLFAQVVQARRRVLGEENPDTLDSISGLVHSRLQQHKYAEAEATLREQLKRYEKAMPESWERYNCQSMLGASLAGQKRYSEAEPVLIAGYGEMQQRQRTIPAPDRFNLDEAKERIVQLYQDWGKPAKAAEWRAKLPKDAASKP